MSDPITSSRTMTLGQLSESLDLHWQHPASPTAAQRATPILDITDDSRRVRPGSLFVARAGPTTDGAAFITDALNRGAAAIVSRPNVDRPEDAPATVAWLTTEDPTHAVALAAHLFHGEPSHHLALVGITGTNGKTTVAHLLQHVLRAAGHRCGLIGTVCTDTGDGPTPASLTTPSACDVAALLGDMRSRDCTHAVMEVSSHALHQGRVAALRFTGGIFTNLSGDHLDYHRDMDDYADAKSRLFRMLDQPDDICVFNADDAYAHHVTHHARGRRIPLSLDPDHDGWRLKHLETVGLGTEVHLETPDGAGRCFPLRLVGTFNVMNALQALVMAVELGVNVDVALRALAQVDAPPGRLERVSTDACPFSVFVDFAHTDDALDRVLDATRAIVPSDGRLVVLFGCGGDRDRTKRPRMAAAACRHADKIYLTSDNPRTESPMAIIEDVLKGLPHEFRVDICVEPDRAAAIDAAIRAAKPHDVIVIAGKGHEDYQIIGRTRSAFDDRTHARQAIERHFGDPATTKGESS